MIRHPEPTPLITTKLKCPKYHGRMVERVILAEHLQQADYKVLLVLAPAGYGKTVFLSQLANISHRPVAWYSLEPHDNDPNTFIRHLAAALQDRTTFDEVHLQRLVSKPDPDGLSRYAVGFFIHALQSRPDGVLIILDNWQVISRPVIYEILSDLVPLLPQQTQLVIGGRNSLDLIRHLALERMHVAGQVQIIDRSDLRFTPDELEGFFRLKDGSLEKEQFDLVVNVSEGWPIAVNFLTQMGSLLEEAKDTIPQVLANYIDREILQGVPSEILEFLIKVSVFSHFTTSDCDQLLGNNLSKERMRYLESHQLFLEEKDDQYYLVPLIRSYLLGKLGSDRDALYKKAGTIGIGRGHLSQAINCFLEAGDRETVADIVVRFGGEAVLHGRWQTVGEWLDTAITAEEIRVNPRLSLLQALVEIGRGQLGHAQRAVNQAESLFLLSDDQIGLAECQLLKARISRGRGAMEESFAFLFDAEANLSASRFKLLLAIEKSIIYYSAGRLQDSRDILQQCLQENEGTGDNEALVMILEALGNITYLLGEGPRALLLFKRAISLCPEGIMPGYNFQDMMSAIYDDWGETEQALLIAQRSAAIKEKMGLTEDLPSSCLQLALVYTNLGPFDDAERYFLQGINYVREHDSDRASLALNLVFLSRTLALQGKWVEARANAKEALEVAESQPLLFRTSIPTVAGPILARTGSWDLGLNLLKGAEKKALRMGFAKSLAYCYQALASLYFLQGDLVEAKRYTQKALVASAKINDLQNFVTCYHWYYPLLVYGLETGTETSFVQRVLRKVGSPSLKHLIPLVMRGDPETKQRIIPILLEIGGSEVCDALDALREDPSAYVRNMAQGAYERLMGTEEVPKSATTKRALGLQLLGPVRIFAGEQEITGVKWRSHRARDLLIYLAHIGQPVSKDQIIEALWPDDYHDLGKADAKFHTTVYRLRSVLKKHGFPDMIKHGTEVYTLAGPIETDLAHFDALMKSAMGSEMDSVEQMNLLEEALEDYHGDYLEYLDYDWAIPDREALRLRYGDAKLRLVSCYLASKQYEKAISELVLLLKRDELNETYHSLLMVAYAKSGQRQAAQRQYAQLTEVLEEELGVKPSLDTQGLYEELNLGSLK